MAPKFSSGKEKRSELEGLLKEKKVLKLSKKLRKNLYASSITDLKQIGLISDEKEERPAGKIRGLTGTGVIGTLLDTILYGLSPIEPSYNFKVNTVFEGLDSSGSIPSAAPPSEPTITGKYASKGTLIGAEFAHTIVAAANLALSGHHYSLAKQFGTNKEKTWSRLCLAGSIARVVGEKVLIWCSRLNPKNASKFYQTETTELGGGTLTTTTPSYHQQTITSAICSGVELGWFLTRLGLKQKNQNNLDLEDELKTANDEVLTELTKDASPIKISDLYDKSARGKRERELIGQYLTSMSPEFAYKDTKKIIKNVLKGRKLDDQIKEYNQIAKKDLITATDKNNKIEELCKYTYNLFSTREFEPSDDKSLLNKEQVKKIFGDDKPYTKLMRGINQYVN